MRLETQSAVRAAHKAMHRIAGRARLSAKARARMMELNTAIEEARTRAVPCRGDAHSNPHIDHCGLCAPWWGFVLPSKEAPWFVANNDGTFHCANCVPSDLDPGAAGIEVWETMSDGWTARTACTRCGVILAEPCDEHEAADLADYDTETLVASVRAGGISRWAFRETMTARGLAGEARAVLDALEST